MTIPLISSQPSVFNRTIRFTDSRSKTIYEGFKSTRYWKDLTWPRHAARFEKTDIVFRQFHRRLHGDAADIWGAYEAFWKASEWRLILADRIRIRISDIVSEYVYADRPESSPDARV